tara:strand:+ start:1191 stop:1343 length:153 start_codon:yes stop_codon:yes gene_type:complete
MGILSFLGLADEEPKWDSEKGEYRFSDYKEKQIKQREKTDAYREFAGRND